MRIISCAIWAILSVVLILTPSSLLAAENSVRDGSWWRSVPKDQQLGYITGIVDGVNASLVPAQSVLSPEQYKQFGSKLATFIDGVRTDQVADGLTAFYQDFANRAILTSAALWVVCMQIHGAPADEIDAAIVMLRRKRSGSE